MLSLELKVTDHLLEEEGSSKEGQDLFFNQPYLLLILFQREVNFEEEGFMNEFWQL